MRLRHGQLDEEARDVRELGDLLAKPRSARTTITSRCPSAAGEGETVVQPPREDRSSFQRGRLRSIARFLGSAETLRLRSAPRPCRTNEELFEKML